MKNYVKLSTKERREYFWYLLLLFIVSCGFLSWLLLYQSSNPFKIISAADMNLLKQKALFENNQQKAVVLYDSAMMKINNYKSSPGNILEADIKNDLKNMRALVSKNADADPRTSSFTYMTTFLELYLTDAMNLRKGIENGQFFQKQLADCRIGFDKNEQRIRAANPTGR